MAIHENKCHNQGSEKAKSRTPRACDRCRLRKSKCDGTPLCKSCQTSDSACMYTARRGREARSYYCQMREVTDQAIRRLYRACRSRSGFPGELLDESNGTPSTTAILDALGLVRPLQEDLGGTEDLPKYLYSIDSSLARPPQKAMSSSSATLPAQDNYVHSPTQSSLSMASVHSPKSRPTSMANNNNASLPATPPEMDMSEQFIYASSEQSSSRSNSTLDAAVYTRMDESSNLTFDLHTYLDTSSCTISPNVPHPIHNMPDPTLYDMSAMMERPGAVYPTVRSSLPAIPFTDGYLTPWPGSLAATYNTSCQNVSLAI